MKKLIVIFIVVSMNAYSQNSKLTKEEKKFVENVIKVQNQEPVGITKRKDNHIVVEFETTMMVLKPDGFVGEMWILGDGDWERLIEE